MNSIEKQKKTVVFILSSNYAGSHYLSLLLGSNSRVEHLGEIKALRKVTGKCFVCGDVGECQLFQGIRSMSLEEIYPTFFSRVSPKVSVLIDNSKKVSWAAQFLDKNDYDFKVIHLIRDPRALVRRWIITFLSFEEKLNQRLKIVRSYPTKILQVMCGRQIQSYIYKWLITNEKITSFIEKNNLNSHVISYRDLSVNPAKEVQELSQWLGVSYEPEQLQYWNFQHHGTQKKEYEWIKEKGSTYFDLRWQEDLSTSQQNSIIQNRDIQKYLRKIGLKDCSDGLTKQL